MANRKAPPGYRPYELGRIGAATHIVVGVIENEGAAEEKIESPTYDENAMRLLRSKIQCGSDDLNFADDALNNQSAAGGAVSCSPPSPLPPLSPCT